MALTSTTVNTRSTIPIPTQKSVGHDSHAQSIDDYNRSIRSQPWYQQWFAERGLNPNKVHLSDQQRHELEQVVIANTGAPKDAFNDMNIDPAGNLNTEHGFHSQPTWLKALEVAAPIAAGAVLTGGAGIPAFLSGTAPTATPTITGTTIGTGMAAAGPASIIGAAGVPAIEGGALATGAAAAAPSVLGAVAPGAVKAAAGHGIMNTLEKAAPLIGIGANVAGSYLSAKQNEKTQQQSREDQQKALLAQFLENEDASTRADNISRASMGLQATQMDPFAQAKDRNSANVRASYGAGIQPGGTFTGNYDLSAIQPDALNKNEEYFQKNVAEAQPNVPLSNPGAEAYRTGRLADTSAQAAQRRADILKYLQSYGAK